MFKKMKLAAIFAFGIISHGIAQTPVSSGPYTFSIVKENAVGSIENQCQTGTCWSFATVSFLEAEVLRKGGKSVDLSEMYNVRITSRRIEPRCVACS
jgi:bleomycin hydrolase